MRLHSLTYLTGLFLYAFSSAYAVDSSPVAERGVIDLREYNFKIEGGVELTGEFEFYWNQMLNPLLEGDSGVVNYIQVPGSWYKLRSEIPEISRYGFATYRLTLLLPKGVDELAFKISGIFSASGFFLDGKAIEYLGFPGVNKYQTLIKYSTPLVTGKVQGEQAELLIKVSNYDHQFSGIVGGITVGLPEQMQTQRQNELFHGHFMIGAFLIIGIYFLGLYLIRTEQYRVYFSMICMLMALRVAIYTQLPFLSQLNMNGLMMVRLDFLHIYFFVPFFTLMIRSLFPYEFPKLLFRLIMWISAVFVVIVVVSPISLFSFSLTWFFVFFLMLSMVFLYVLFLAWSRGRSYAPAFTIGLLILFLGALNDMLMEIDLIESQFLGHYAMFAYLLVYAYIFAGKSNELQKKAKKLSGELNQVRNNLEDLVEERTTELQLVSKQLSQQKRKLEVSNRDLVEAMNARNRLFAIIGHDVRAPIGYTRQALEMLLENKEMKRQERDDLLRMMASSSEITYNLLDNLLVWGRSQTGKLKANPVSFPLKALVDESLELVNIGIREKELKIEVVISDEHCIEADRDQLYVVIRNLLSNSIKFSPWRGSIRISSVSTNGEVIIDITDTGIGIPESIRSKLLDTKSHITTNGTKGEKGSGLGLKICNEIIYSNNGWMEIKSESGSGTTVRIGIKAAKKSTKKTTP
ncbi:MAG: sensor histidine kinase [Bacteroidota bacterium]